MGLYLNQLPPAEVARIKRELAETLIANFCYPRFYDYRVNALRMRPVERAKRQEVWQYLNAVDFNVWGRVDVDSPDFQRQVERLFIHFVQRNRNFFGPQGRRRMTDVRTLITSTSNALAADLREYLQSKQENSPLGSPRPALSWSNASITGQAEPAWEQILPGTMQLQQQIQELHSETQPASAPLPSAQAQPAQISASFRPGQTSRRSRVGRSVANSPVSNGSSSDERGVPATPKEVESPFPAFSAAMTSTEAAATMPLPLSKQEKSSEAPPVQSGRLKRGATGKPPATVAVSAPGLPRRPGSQHQASAQALQTIASPAYMTNPGAPQAESPTVLTGDEDVVIFEQLRYQLLVWLRVEAVRSGIELQSQGAFQLVEILRRQDGMDLARLQVVSTLLNICEQIITSGRAALADYKQAMMFYLMHTRHNR